MKTLKDFNFKGKKVLLRNDFNVPLDKEGNILNDFRIRKSLPTIGYLVREKAKVISLSHLGRPEGKKVERLRLNKIRDRLKEYLKGYQIKKTNDCLGREVERQVSKLKEGEILLLENLRFHKEEIESDLEFAKKLSKFGDVFIEDGFGVCHRNHASVVGIPKYLPSGAGFLLEGEIKNLSKVLRQPPRPLVMIIGGVKISTKIKPIREFLKRADHLLLGGQIANVILRVKGINIGKPWPTEDVVEMIEEIELTSPKLHLPVDVAASSDGEVYLRKAAPGKIMKNEMPLDIGSETIHIFSNIIKKAKTIVWSGPLGKFELEKYSKGTKAIANEIIRNHAAFSVVGGGDTILAISKFNLLDKFSHVSTGGGALLQFLSGEKLPGIEALK